MNITLTKDILGLIANAIDDPITFEHFGMCCRKTAAIVRQKRAIKTDFFLNRLSNNQLHKIQKIIKKSQIIVVTSIIQSSDNRSLFLNYLLKNINRTRGTRFKIKKIDEQILMTKKISAVQLNLFHKIMNSRKPMCLVADTDNYIEDYIDFIDQYYGYSEEVINNMINNLPEKCILIISASRNKKIKNLMLLDNIEIY